MPVTILTPLPGGLRGAGPRDIPPAGSEHDALENALQARLEAARPRLVRLARLRGVSADVADDVAQESLVTAWRSLNRLRSPERFDSWLDGICRNISRRYVSESQNADRTVPLSLGLDGDDAALDDVSASGGEDLTDALTRQELATLLDRALGHLTPAARDAIELCYLAELPEREAALRLGLTINALEARLSRARRQLREVLSGALREDARAFDLALDEETALGWRESRLWCHFCGQRRLQGIFERTDAGTGMTLRCPDCWPGIGIEDSRTDPIPLLNGMTSFRPALKRLTSHYGSRFVAALRGDEICPDCGTALRARVVHGTDAEGFTPTSVVESLWFVESGCARCGHSAVNAVTIAGITYPRVREFMFAQPRWILEPAMLTSYQTQPALRFGLRDLTTNARLTVFARPATLDVLACVDE